MIIYIRHAHDNEVDTKYQHDGHITKKGLNRSRELVHNLVQKYGFPTKIYFSPFRRCTETMMAMINELVFLKTNKKANYCMKCYDYDGIKLISDNALSRYFTSYNRKKPTVSPKTLKFNIPIYESKEDFNQRISRHVKIMKNTAKKNENIWCITHALAYKKIAKNYGIVTKKFIPFLEHFVIVN